MALPDDFWLPANARSDFRKVPPPKTGPAFGNWAGRDLESLQLPGGGMLQFDLNRLTLADYRSMRDHYQINASLTVLQFMLHRMDWRIECEDQDIADGIEENLRRVWTRMVRAMSQAYWAGFSPIALEYENDPLARGGKGMLVISKFKDLIPEEVDVNWKEVEGYAPPGQLPPKYKEYDGIKQRGLRWPIPAENTLWYPLLMENGDYRGKKLLRSAFSSWYFSILLHLYANRYYERFGEPVPVGRAPYDDDVTINGTTVSGREAMETILTNLRNRSVVVLPDERIQISDTQSAYSYDIEYLESQMRGADFEKYITRLDEEITLGLFTPLLLLRGASGGGSYNLGVQQMQMYLWMLNALAGDMKEYIDHYIVDRLKGFNWGPNAPRATWEFRQMGKENVETMRSVITELVRSDKVGVDLTQLGAAIGLTLTEMDQLTDPNSDPYADPGNTTDPAADPAAPDTDTRQRTERSRAGSGPKGVGSSRATGRAIAARIGQQVTKAYGRGGFASAPVMGFRRAVVDDLCTAGLSYDAAASGTEWLYSRMNTWLADMSHDLTIHDSPEKFMAAFDATYADLYGRVLDGTR
jgi:hypothetical protein